MISGELIDDVGGAVFSSSKTCSGSSIKDTYTKVPGVVIKENEYRIYPCLYTSTNA